PMRFQPTLLVAEPARELRWRGRLVLPGLFDGEHWLRLQPDGTSTRLVHGERFSGLLVPLLAGTLDRTRAGFEAMNAALKAEAERAWAEKD
ncbi:MAG: SRPBCC domain-containing protein, partial [Sphingomonadaceae bacterium]